MLLLAIDDRQDLGQQTTEAQLCYYQHSIPLLPMGAEWQTNYHNETVMQIGFYFCQIHKP